MNREFISAPAPEEELQEGPMEKLACNTKAVIEQIRGMFDEGKVPKAINELQDSKEDQLSAAGFFSVPNTATAKDIMAFEQYKRDTEPLFSERDALYEQLGSLMDTHESDFYEGKPEEVFQHDVQCLLWGIKLLLCEEDIKLPVTIDNSERYLFVCGLRVDKKAGYLLFRLYLIGEKMEEKIRFVNVTNEEFAQTNQERILRFLIETVRRLFENFTVEGNGRKITLKRRYAETTEEQHPPHASSSLFPFHSSSPPEKGWLSPFPTLPDRQKDE